jgi:hypothetical protein
MQYFLREGLIRLLQDEGRLDDQTIVEVTKAIKRSAAVHWRKWKWGWFFCHAHTKEEVKKLMGVK